MKKIRSLKTQESGLSIKELMQQMLSGTEQERIEKVEQLEAAEEETRSLKAARVIIRRRLQDAKNAGDNIAAEKLQKELSAIEAKTLLKTENRSYCL